jgi:hypothetical protein
MTRDCFVSAGVEQITSCVGEEGRHVRASICTLYFQHFCLEGGEGKDMLYNIEEGRAASRSPHQKFGYFLSMSQQALSADIIPNSAVGIFSLRTEGTKT